MKHKKNNYLLAYFIIISIIVLSAYLYIRVTKENFTTSVTYDIIILAGQSNSVGRGLRNHGITPDTIRGIKSPEDNEDSNIKQLKDYGRTIASGTHPIELMVNLNQPTVGLVGHGLAFAKAYLAQNPGKKVLIVGAGYTTTGSSVLNPVGAERKQWIWNDTNRSLFKTIVTSLELAKTKGVHSNSSVKALLWDQGETDMTPILSDTSGTGAKTTYKNNLKNGFSNLRSNCRRLFPNTNATFPILLTGMCVAQNYFNNVRNNSATPYRINMNTYLSGTCVPFLNTQITNVKYVPTDNSGSYSNVLESNAILDASGNPTTSNNDIIHFSATSQRELGRRFYDVYSTMQR